MKDTPDFLSASAATLETTLPAQRNRSRGMVSLGLGILIFLAGLVTGAAMMRAAMPRPLASLDELPDRIAGRMQGELDLNDVQRDELAAIIRSHQPELRRIRAQIFPEMRAEIRRTIDEMATVLTPEQAQNWRPTARRNLDVHFPPVGSAAATDNEPL